LTLNTFRIQNRDVKQYKKIFFQFFKTDLSGEKWCWQKRPTIHTALHSEKRRFTHKVNALSISFVKCFPHTEKYHSIC